MLNDNMIVFKNVVQRLVDEGHGTGFHGVSHELSKLYATDDSAIEEFKTCNKTFYNITGETSRLVRIPFGSKPNMLENIFNKPLEQPKEEKQEDIITLRFTVRGTRTKLKVLKEFLENGGYDYE